MGTQGFICARPGWAGLRTAVCVMWVLETLFTESPHSSSTWSLGGLNLQSLTRTVPFKSTSPRWDLLSWAAVFHLWLLGANSCLQKQYCPIFYLPSGSCFISVFLPFSWGPKVVSCPEFNWDSKVATYSRASLILPDTGYTPSLLVKKPFTFSSRLVIIVLKKQGSHVFSDIPLWLTIPNSFSHPKTMNPSVVLCPGPPLSNISSKASGDTNPLHCSCFSAQRALGKKEGRRNIPNRDWGVS